MHVVYMTLRMMKSSMKEAAETPTDSIEAASKSVLRPTISASPSIMKQSS